MYHSLTTSLSTLSFGPALPALLPSDEVQPV